MSPRLFDLEPFLAEAIREMSRSFTIEQTTPGCRPNLRVMQTRTVSSERWEGFFDSFTRIYRGSRATLEILADDLGAQMQVEDMPLSGISSDSTGLALHFQTRGGHFVHRIPFPRTVSIEQRANGLVAAIEICCSDGEPDTILRLRAALASRLLSA